MLGNWSTEALKTEHEGEHEGIERDREPVPVIVVSDPVGLESRRTLLVE